MELNITICFQIIMLFIVFTFLSNFLFYPLEKISFARKKQVLLQMEHIENIKNNILVHERYIKSVTQRFENISQTINSEIIASQLKKKELRTKFLTNKINENHLKILQKIEYESDKIHSELLNNIEKFSSKVVEKICKQ